MTKAKVLFASFDEVPSFKGATTHILSTFRCLRDAYDITLVTLGAQKLPALPGLEHRPLALREGNFLKRIELFRRAISEMVKSESFDLFHFRAPWEGRVLSDQGRPSVYEVNGLPSVELLETYELNPALVAKIENEERTCIQNSSLVICPSEQTRSFLERRFPNASIMAIPNGYDQPNAPSIRLGGDRLRLVYVGTLHPWQGLLWSLRVFRDLQIELHLYSTEHKIWSPILRKRIRKFGLQDRVFVHEPVAHAVLLSELGTYDAGFAPLLRVPRNEDQGCFPIKNLDYLAAGLPVVASALPVNSQLLQPANAIFFAPNRLSDLRITLSSLSIERCARARKGVRASLAGHPTWADYSVRIKAIYDSLLARGIETQQTL